MIAVGKTRYMVNKATREVYAWSEALEEAKDAFAPYYDPLPKIGPDGLRRAVEGCEYEDDGFKVKVGDPKTEEKYNEERIDKLVAAMNEMSRIEFTTINGMPNLRALEKVVKFLPSKDERDVAYGRYMAAKQAAEAAQEK